MAVRPVSHTRLRAVFGAVQSPAVLPAMRNGAQAQEPAPVRADASAAGVGRLPQVLRPRRLGHVSLLGQRVRRVALVALAAGVIAFAATLLVLDGCTRGLPTEPPYCQTVTHVDAAE